MDYKQCCIECGFHFFDEDECPACRSYQIQMEYDREWQAELSAISVVCGFEVTEKLFDDLWYSHSKRFRIITMQVAPEIHDWYTSIDNEVKGLLYEETEQPGQLELFQPELPF